MRVALRTLMACTSYRTARRAEAHGPHGLKQCASKMRLSSGPPPCAPDGKALAELNVVPRTGFPHHAIHREVGHGYAALAHKCGGEVLVSGRVEKPLAVGDAQHLVGQLIDPEIHLSRGR